jgi:GT2 family glycosyltransferase
MYGNWPATRCCLEAVQKRLRGNWRIVLVDNASPGLVGADSAAWVRAQGGLVADSGASAPEFSDLPSLSLVRRGQNGGFAAGVNAGLAWAAADPGVDAFWLLNNDTEPEANALVALREALANLPSAGAVASLLVRTAAPERVQALGGGRYWPALGWTDQLGEDRRRDAMPVAPVRLDQALAASLLIPRRVLAEVGPFPEHYFMYVEDTAWCVALRRAGFAIYGVPASIVHHAVGLSTGSEGISDYYLPRNHLWLAREQHRAFALTALSFLLIRVLAPKVLRGQWGRAFSSVRGLWHGLTQSPGPCGPSGPAQRPCANARSQSKR